MKDWIILLANKVTEIYEDILIKKNIVNNDSIMNLKIDKINSYDGAYTVRFVIPNNISLSSERLILDDVTGVGILFDTRISTTLFIIGRNISSLDIVAEGYSWPENEHQFELKTGEITVIR